MKIRIWSDFACPFCYMGEHMLENEIEKSVSAGNQAVEIELHAYELSPDAPVMPVESMEEHFCASHDITAEQAQSQMSRITKMAARAGLECNLEGVRVCSTFDAHRLVKLAYDTKGPEIALKLNSALFHANFVENKRLSDQDVLKAIAVEAGLDPVETDDTLSSDRYAAEVREDEKEADSLGLEYIPYMRFSDGKVLQGALSAGAIRKAVNKDSEA